MRCWLWGCTGPAASPHQLLVLACVCCFTGSAAKAVLDDLLGPDDGDSIWMPEVSPPADDPPPQAIQDPAAEGSSAGGAQQHSQGLAAAGAGMNHHPAPGAAAAVAGAPGQPGGSQVGPGAQQEAAAAQAAMTAEQESDQGSPELAMSDAETEDYGASPVKNACLEAGTSDAAAATEGNGMGPAGKAAAKLTSGAAMHDPYEFIGTEVQQTAVPEASRPASAAAPHQVGH